MQKEIWKSVKGYEGIYEVSSLGKVRSLDRIVNYKNQGKPVSRNAKGRIIKQQYDKDGYKIFSLLSNKITKRIHQLVAEHFIPNPENKPQVNHRNGIKTDNWKDNLEWCTAKENTRHAHENNLVNVPKSHEHYFSKAVIDIKTGIIYGCIREAAEMNNIKTGTLSSYLTGRVKNKTNLRYAEAH